MDLFSAIPAEVLTGLVSAAGGAYAKISAARADQSRLAVELLARQAGIATEAAQAAASRGGKWVRRILALMAGAYIFAWPCLWPLMSAFRGPEGPIRQDVQTVYLSSELGGVWPFRADKIKPLNLSGFVVTPLQTHLAAAVFFFYFGAGVTERRRA